jgi:large subunit ribosomal protein L29
MRLAQRKDQLRESSVPELERMLQDERKNLFMARKDSAMKTLENPMRIRLTRKNIARILTFIRQRELESAGGKK